MSGTCRLAGKNPQSVRVVHPLDLHSATTEDRQERRILKREDTTKTVVQPHRLHL